MFAHRLALALGRVDVDAMLAELDAQELMRWLGYHQLEPWGEERADLRAGIVASTIANVHRGKGKAPFRVRDFMPRFRKAVKQTPEQMAAILTMAAKAAMGARRK